MGNLVSEIGQGELKHLPGQCGRIHQESEALSGAVVISEYELHADMYLPSLETTLRNFSCLTIGDGIMVAYNNKKYYIDIIESKPSNAISIIERDCEVDFAPPLDYKEPEKLVAPVPLNKATAQVEEDPAATEPKFCFRI